MTANTMTVREDMELRTAIRTGDRVTWDAPQFEGGSFYRGRCRGAKYTGSKELSGVVVKHSYGSERNQHTFTILLDDGRKKLVKGRNLYPNIIKHIPDPDSIDRQEEAKRLAAMKVLARRFDTQARELLADMPGGVTAQRLRKLVALLACHDGVTLHTCSDEWTGERFGQAKCRRGRSSKIGRSTYRYQLWATWTRTHPGWDI